MVIKKTYYPIGLPAVENTGISDAALAYVQPLMVARSGVVFNLTDNDGVLISGNPFYKYTPSTGTIQFNPNIPFESNESINVIYETNP